MVRAGAGIFDKLVPEPELEPDKNGPAPQHCQSFCRNRIQCFVAPLFTKSEIVYRRQDT
jgi:hypothetical protein